MGNDSTFGVYLKKLRESRNLKISSLAKKSGVSTSYLSRIEEGSRKTPQPDILRKLTPHLDVGYFELMLKAGHIPEDSEILFVDDDQTKQLILNMSESKKHLFKELDDLDEETIFSLVEFIQNFKKCNFKKDSD
ncbi:MAG: transcriptional regulator [Halanaerobiales bacterium]|nr:transcriptional regulator [Halanaerobiales bacterium]